MSKVEVDVVRSAIVFTSAGLDATMKRLVNDVGRALVPRPGTGHVISTNSISSSRSLPQVSTHICVMQ